MKHKKQHSKTVADMEREIEFYRQMCQNLYALTSDRIWAAGRIRTLERQIKHQLNTRRHKHG